MIEDDPFLKVKAEVDALVRAKEPSKVTPVPLKLTIKRSEHIGDWYIIERAEHDGRMWEEEVEPQMFVLRCSSRFSDADVEGTAFEMRAMARAIETRSAVYFKRCAVEIQGEMAVFYSPRNSQVDGLVPYEDARALAVEIRSMCGEDDP